MANNIRIETPRGKLYPVKRGSGRVTCTLRWNPGFRNERTRAFTDAQSYVDSEVLRLCGPYVPFQTGMLMRSGELGTVIGSGEVRYIATYSHRLYYGTHFHFDQTAHPRAGAMWFDRMKVDHADSILRGAAALAGGKANG